MSSIKPVIRELREAVLGGMSHAKGKLHQVADNLDGHFDDVIRQVTDRDHFDGKPDLPGAPHAPHRPESGQTSGPVVFYDPKAGSTAAQQAQVREYVEGSNRALHEGYLAPEGRVSTSGALRDDASAAAAAERRRNPYTGHAGHVPDTTWTGKAEPHSWLDLDPSVNQSLGGQSRRYPVGYQPTEFVYGGRNPS